MSLETVQIKCAGCFRTADVSVWEHPKCSAVFAMQAGWGTIFFDGGTSCYVCSVECARIVARATTGYGA